MHLSVVIPAFNESRKIVQDLETTERFFRDKPYSSEVLVVDDGSRDGTRTLVEAFIERRKTTAVVFRSLHYGENRGKGYAIRYGMKHAQGKIRGFMDSGLCVPLDYWSVAIEKIESGADYAIASRRLQGTKITRAQPLYRRLGSKAFWLVVRGLMGVGATDTQCGFKVYSAAAATAIFSRVRTDGFMFDIEALLIAQNLKLRGAEFPVEWANDGDTRYHPVWGTFRNFKELVKIRLRPIDVKGPQ